jgi:hypothetical protein
MNQKRAKVNFSANEHLQSLNLAQSITLDVKQGTDAVTSKAKDTKLRSGKTKILPVGLKGLTE